MGVRKVTLPGSVLIAYTLLPTISTFLAGGASALLMCSISMLLRSTGLPSSVAIVNGGMSMTSALSVDVSSMLTSVPVSIPGIFISYLPMLYVAVLPLIFGFGLTTGLGAGIGRTLGGAVSMIVVQLSASTSLVEGSTSIVYSTYSPRTLPLVSSSPVYVCEDVGLL